MNKLYVILPCYNEEANIASLMDAWLCLKEDLSKMEYELVLTPVDDGSADKTKEIILEKAAKEESIHPLIHEKNKGLGGALFTGISYFHETCAGGIL